MIKYLGSKRRLVPQLGALLEAVEANTALDLFTGTTRVAQEFKARGAHVTAVDTARYSEVFATCAIALDATTLDLAALDDALAHLNALPGKPGYVTETFCHRSRFFHPDNGARIDAVRDAIEEHAGTWLHPVLLASLIRAADRVDSTTGVQMAYLKQWAPRALGTLELTRPPLLAGPGRAVRADARAVAGSLGPFDLAYLDPPYNQHRYFTNYHVWETLVAWDRPESYGVACKRVDARDPATHSPFNRKADMAAALAAVVAAVDARVVVISYNNEAWVSLDELRDMAAVRGAVEILEFDSKRYVGAQIGIHNPAGEKVGRVSHLRNKEWVAICGEPGDVARGRAAMMRPWDTRTSASRSRITSPS